MDTPTKSVLPNKPSGLIKNAVQDLILCEEDPRYTIDMMYWHEPVDQTCRVCLAGVVIAQTLHGDINKLILPTDFYPEYIKLAALNFFHQGQIQAACQVLGIENCPINDRDIVEYSTSTSTQFKTQLLGIAKDLEGVGL